MEKKKETNITGREKDIEKLTELLNKQGFKSEEELTAFLEKIVEQSQGNLSKSNYSVI